MLGTTRNIQVIVRFEGSWRSLRLRAEGAAKLTVHEIAQELAQKEGLGI